MAEGQGPYPYSQPTRNELVARLSNERFATYLNAAGLDIDRAFELYLYNARLSKSFLYPLHVMEVALRNAVHAVLQNLYPAGWPTDAAFLNVLSQPGQNTLTTALGRLAASGKANPSPNDVVAALSLDFWANLFHGRYHLSLWQQNMAHVFPNNPTITRANFHSEIKRINRLRNRIAHHEPIFTANVATELALVLRVIGYCSTEVRQWTDAHATVSRMAATHPQGAVAPPVLCLRDRCDPNFATCRLTQPLSAVLAAGRLKVLFCSDDDGILRGVLGPDDVGQFLAGESDATGLFDAGEHTVDDVVRANGRRFRRLPGSLSLRALAQEFGRASIVVVEDEGTPVGFIQKAHRQY